MKLMAFSMTTKQMRDRSKDVTRRIGWADLKAGDRVGAIVKGQGLKKGEKVKRICVIEVVSNELEEIASGILDRQDAQEEVNREGFPDLTPHQFVEMFCKANRCAWFQKVNRIEFKYV